MQLRGFRKPLVVLAALVSSTAAVPAQLSVGDRVAVEAYRSALKSADSGPSVPRQLERAFSALARLGDALMHVREGQIVLESLSDDEFKRLQRELTGVIINREEVVFVAPDADYFVKLAARRGDAADRAFFSALKAMYPESVWPVYVEQQTDYSGCTRFGSLALVEAHGAWADFQRKFPNRYVAAAKKETDEVIQRLTESTCACGDSAGIQRELQQFLRRFPQSPARPQIERRLQAIRAGRSGIRTSCLSG